jgi:ubiquitin C-terminal hydrolase
MQESSYGGHRGAPLRRASRKVSKTGDSWNTRPAPKIAPSNLNNPRSKVTMESTKGYGGLLNMGLTCYANSVIQALRHSAKLAWIFGENGQRTLFRENASPLRAKQQSCTDSLANVVALLNNAEKNQVVRPSDFWDKVHTVTDDTGYEHFARKMPHDAHEFYTFLIDTIHEATSIEVDMRVLADETTLQARALAVWKRAFEKQYSPFVDQFYGLFHSTVTCEACGNASHTWEPFTSLKLSMPDGGDPPTLEDLLSGEWKPETIEDYACEKCAPARTTAQRKTHIWRLPQYLTIVLKRFSYTGQKIRTKLAPMPLLHMSFEPYFSNYSPEKVGKTEYRLFAIVDHHGSSFGGHYTAQARHPKEDTWHVYDDESIIQTAAPMFGETTYMLMFERSAAGYA